MGIKENKDGGFTMSGASMRASTQLYDDDPYGMNMMNLFIAISNLGHRAPLLTQGQRDRVSKIAVFLREVEPEQDRDTCRRVIAQINDASRVAIEIAELEARRRRGRRVR